MFISFKDSNKTIMNLNYLVMIEARELETDPLTIKLIIQHPVICSETLIYADNHSRNEDAALLLEKMKSYNGGK